MKNNNNDQNRRFTRRKNRRLQRKLIKAKRNAWHQREKVHCFDLICFELIDLFTDSNVDR